MSSCKYFFEYKLYTFSFHLLKCPFSDQDCFTNGLTYQHAERWRSGGCTQCYCDDGYVICDQISCPARACDNPIPPAAGQCCPTCGRKYYSAVDFGLDIVRAYTLFI